MNVFSPVHSRTRAIALYRPASHGCSFLNGARKEYVCFAAAFFSSALIISYFPVFQFSYFQRFFTEYLFTDVCPSNGILPMLRISNRKNLQPEL
jgi:hypothetical protein